MMRLDSWHRLKDADQHQSSAVAIGNRAGKQMSTRVWAGDGAGEVSDGHLEHQGDVEKAYDVSSG